MQEIEIAARGMTFQALADGPDGGHCQAALAASIFHFKHTTVGEVKRRLLELSIPVRPPAE